MHHTKTYTIDELRALLATLEGQTFKAENKAEAYDWIEGQLKRYRYDRLRKKDRRVIRQYLKTYTGYSASQLTRLIARWKQTHRVRLKAYKRHMFARHYTRDDIVLLAHVDTIHGLLSGPATRCILERECTVFGQAAYERLSRISASHIYNLRKTFTYHNHAVVFTHTKGNAKVTLGERRKPEPNGKPGYLRVDSVHQGDALASKPPEDEQKNDSDTDSNRDKNTNERRAANETSHKGVYHINFVDEVTQYEFVACVETIGERDMLPVLEAMLAAFPFVIHEFHADNGSEYINKLVAELLNRLHVKLSKSRPRRHNDNALVETKNGSIIRKAIGYGHIPKHHATAINVWYRDWFNTYLNYHRPCAFATIRKDGKGKEKLVYKHDDYQTPYEKLKGLPNATTYLKPNSTFDRLDEIAYAVSDTEYAEYMNQAKERLDEAIHTKVKDTEQTFG
jgi:transposase InsO family protein